MKLQYLEFSPYFEQLPSHTFPSYFCEDAFHPGPTACVELGQMFGETMMEYLKSGAKQ